MILFGPVGLHELRLIYENGLAAFPPRLPEQPIFYPVLNIEYARQIAFGWNTKFEPFAGYITEFGIDDGYISQFERHIVGGHIHEEFWIPSEKLDEFNRFIIGKIKVVDAKFGKEFQGFVPQKFGLHDKKAICQFVILANSYNYNLMDFSIEIMANHTAIFLNYPFWLMYDFEENGVDVVWKNQILGAIKDVWLHSFPEIPLMDSFWRA
jgi:hypothetical protein